MIYRCSFPTDTLIRLPMIPSVARSLLWTGVGFLCCEALPSSFRRTNPLPSCSGFVQSHDVVNGSKLSCLDLCDGIAPSFRLWHSLVRISRTFSRSPSSFMFMLMAFALFGVPLSMLMFSRSILMLLCFLHTTRSGSSIIVCTGLIVTRRLALGRRRRFV